MSIHKELRQQVFDSADQQVGILEEGLKTSFDSLDSFQEWVTARLREFDGSIDRFSLSTKDLSDQPALQRLLETNPDAIRLGTNVVGDLPGQGTGTTLLFAHADKTPASYRYVAEGHGTDFSGDHLTGPGIADDVSGVTAIIGALKLLDDTGRSPVGSVKVASILGKQLGAAGTYGLMRRHTADAAVYVHPAESGQGLSDLKMGSSGLYEFVVTLEGRPPTTDESHHPLYAHQGVNPVEIAETVARRLRDWSDQLAARHRHSGVERVAGTSAGLLISDVQTETDSRAVYVMPRTCTMRAVLAFPPGVSLETVETSVRRVVRGAATEAGATDVSVSRGDYIADSAETSPDSSVARTAVDAITGAASQDPTAYYGHAASDIRYPIQYWDAPTVGLGPRAGSMGEPEEWIDRHEYLETISAIAAFLTDFDPEAEA